MRNALVAAALLFSAGSALAQSTADPALFEALRKADGVLFEEGFNRCNMKALEELIHPDLEFLHDQSGRDNRESFFKAIRANICGNPAQKPLRRLVEGTLEAHPLSNQGKLYGAVQLGRHDFYISEPGKEPRRTGTARFVHTWLLDGDRWKLYRVVSYDHRPAN